MFSVGDVYQRIKTFKSTLEPGPHVFYFAKVDVQAAFDTIPQDAVIELLKQIPGQSDYSMLKHVEMSLLDAVSASGLGTKPTRRWHVVARANNDKRSFPERIETSLAAKKKNTVFVNSALQKKVYTRDLLALTATHIGQNLVRIGKKYYRQKTGIPQGSVLSSTLCNYFYADLERNHLSFLQEANCLLLRLIDDFILITTDQEKARQFVGVMHGGLPEYGVTVSPEKSLVNFAMTAKGTAVPVLANGRQFPYCGLLINCKTLAVTKLRDGAKGPGMLSVPSSTHFYKPE